ncbi:MAG: D-glycero-beta-D-manno-heptose-7-phosphate kinase [Oscillatoriales cyanobacterium RM2_1_1]|nr:D-glycero-beta-D-manno-heptose-7-phosphate kinase [Oscillatoriales cyanobacterium SM2_3_0]NJO44868.1 D-glycero-beta-D-manno-heptose-7-phosphate kinase [Oscillatoriales cyanobacterium RM2_1_1]
MNFDGSFLNQLQRSSDALFQYLEQFPRVRVLVIGDLTLDEFLMGQAERISREAPVLILRHEVTRQIPGGGANAVYNLARLGAQVKVGGFLGKDEQGSALQQIFQGAGIDTRGILIDPNRPTVTKTRISGHARQSVNQQIVRIDRKSDDPPELDLQLQLADYVKQQLATVDAVVCSDYGDGALMAPVIAAALEHDRTIVDTQTDLHRFQSATLFTPNLPEAEQAVGYGITNQQTLLRAGQDLLQMTQARAMLITRGEAGMTLFEQTPTGLTSQHIPAFNRTEVFDVTGAGDTVVAALTLGLCSGASLWEAAVLGNLAASLVVRQFGTATTTTDAMAETLRSLLNLEGSES